jgi:pyridoxine 5-phosphate synthase
MVQLHAAQALGVQISEFHTGRYVEFVQSGEVKLAELELDRIRTCAEEAVRIGIEPQAGHGLTFDTVQPVAAIAQITELNIGHFLVGEAIFIGLPAAIAEMRRLMDEARA